MSHVTHMNQTHMNHEPTVNESCHPYESAPYESRTNCEWVMLLDGWIVTQLLQRWMNHDPTVNESCRLDTWVKILTKSGIHSRWQVTLCVLANGCDESRPNYAWVMLPIWIIYGLHLIDSYHTYERCWVESWHTYEWGMLPMNASWHTYALVIRECVMVWVCDSSVPTPTCMRHGTHTHIWVCDTSASHIWVCDTSASHIWVCDTSASHIWVCNTSAAHIWVCDTSASHYTRISHVASKYVMSQICTNHVTYKWFQRHVAHW